jgi:hypothetical protein
MAAMRCIQAKVKRIERKQFIVLGALVRSSDYKFSKTRNYHA